MTTDLGISLGQAIRDGLDLGIVHDIESIAILEATAPDYPIHELPICTDVSFWQGEIYWPGAWEDGVRLATIRAGQRHGLSGWTDSRFVENWTNARSAGLLRNLYWVWDPSASGQQHLDGIHRALDLVGDSGELQGVFDLELEPVRWGDVDVIITGMNDIWGRPPIVYSGAWFLNRVVVPPWFRALPHWLTGYNSIGPDYPRDYSPTVIEWQQTSSWVVDWVESTSVDRDYWLNLLLGLWRYANVTDKVVKVNDILEWLAQNQIDCDTEPEPPPPGELDEYEVVVLGNFRTSPGTGNNLIRLINAGEHVWDLGERVDDWWKVRDQNDVDGWFWTNEGVKLKEV